ncbi:MAG: hypothetical protein ACREVI_15760 [Steroidobacteraceae bacterium]
MTRRNGYWWTAVLASLLAGSAAMADDIRPEADQDDARPFADEKCIEQCDTQSDKCMQDSMGDSAKQQVCDDQYSECLQACEAP